MTFLQASGIFFWMLVLVCLGALYLGRVMRNAAEPEQEARCDETEHGVGGELK